MCVTFNTIRLGMAKLKQQKVYEYVKIQTYDMQH